ncbi:MAG TPA: hypothetical protein VGT40_07925 [Methylomirabilota bacterium]|jgi:hypothetical protein|nr:hypothetical protein [Methylomirabilota bacterium]
MKMTMRSSAGSIRNAVRYLPYFIRDFPGQPEVEARWAWEWMASRGLLSGAFDPTSQINRKVEREAHGLAAAGLSG